MLVTEAIWPNEVKKPDDSPVAKAYRLAEERRHLRRNLASHEPGWKKMVHVALYLRLGKIIRASGVTRAQIEAYRNSISSRRTHPPTCGKVPRALTHAAAAASHA